MKTFQEASDDCASEGGRLANIRGYSDLSQLSNLLSFTSWIGLSQPGEAVIEPDQGWVWSDGSTNTSFWLSGQPNDIGKQDCAALGTFNIACEFITNFVVVPTQTGYADFNCDEKRYYVCEASSTCTFPSLSPTVAPSVMPTVNAPTPCLCPEGSFPSANGMYCLEYIQAQMSFSDSASFCETRGSKLASLRSDADYSLINSNIFGSLTWVGLWQNSTSAKDEPDLEWYWMDTEVDYISWVTGQPNEVGEQGI